MEKPGNGTLQNSRICRLCLSQSGVMSPIFEYEDTASSLSLSLKIMAFISIQIYAQDGLPTLICHRCLYQVEKSYEFKTQCETTDAMLRKYFSSLDGASNHDVTIKTEPADESLNSRDPFRFPQATNNFVSGLYQDSPFKRKRGRPRKEENFFYNSALNRMIDGQQMLNENEIKIVDGIESVVTVVDPRTDVLSEEEIKTETIDVEEHHLDIKPIFDPKSMTEVKLDSLAVAKAKAKKYMGVVFGVDNNGLKTRRHLCKGCGKTFGHCSDLRKHVLVHTGERPFHCQICSKNFSRSTNLNKHLKVHTGQKPFVCSVCPKSFTTKGDLQRHCIIHSGIKPFSCHLCHHCFSRKDKLTRHLKLHDSSNLLKKMNFKCVSCPQVYHSKLDLDRHVENLHKNNNEMNGSTGDGERLEQNNSVDVSTEKDKQVNGQDVESMVISLDPFQMDNDPVDVGSGWSGKESMSAKTISDKLQLAIGSGITVTPIPKSTGKIPPTDGDTNAKPHQCKICRRRYADMSLLNSHMVTHTAAKPHKCNLCDKSFSRRRELLRHENVHTGIKPFKCQKCGKAFSRKDKLVRHEKIHNGVKNFLCTFCPATFCTRNELNLHNINCHTKDNVFTCVTCFKTYKSKYDLLKHDKIHIQTPSFICEVCAIGFDTQDILLLHMTTHDAVDGDEENGVVRTNQNTKIHSSHDESDDLTEEDDINFTLNQLAMSSAEVNQI